MDDDGDVGLVVQLICPGFAQLIHSPNKWVVEPMQVKGNPNENPNICFLSFYWDSAYMFMPKKRITMIVNLILILILKDDDNPCCLRLTIHVVSD